jgi:hypothetical protein
LSEKLGGQSDKHHKFFSDDFLTLLLLMQITAFGGDIEHVLQFAYGEIL